MAHGPEDRSSRFRFFVRSPEPRTGITVKTASSESPLIVEQTSVSKDRRLFAYEVRCGENQIVAEGIHRLTVQVDGDPTECLFVPIKIVLQETPR